MNEDERKLLHDTHDMAKEVHDALLEVPTGSPRAERPLLVDLRLMVRAWKGLIFSVKALVWLIPTIAGVGIAWRTIAEWFAG